MTKQVIIDEISGETGLKFRISIQLIFLEWCISSVAMSRIDLSTKEGCFLKSISWRQNTVGISSFQKSTMNSFYRRIIPYTVSIIFFDGLFRTFVWNFYQRPIRSCTIRFCHKLQFYSKMKISKTFPIFLLYPSQPNV